ncbi:MAG: DUF3341 domain-containing protein [Bdellovibrionales bacterium]|nr:DUF3341 domain-containing protein [Bdellovibrionales bacterium]
MLKTLMVAEFTDEQQLFGAVKGARQKEISIYDAYTPFAVHGLDEAMGIKRSRLPIVCFLACALGCLLAMWLQIWTSSIDWPINVGGKPFNSFPAFIPVAFEITVLLGGLITVGVFFARSRLYWGKKPELFVEGTTNDRFVIALEVADARIPRDAMIQLLKDCGAISIGYSEVEK